ncbi:hypothetical protein EV360DRAFT_75855 [Lentinula raphanica]|nr:hypothetical protein EV360DRAFT_75855 [Lentinula raphanica]
MNVDLQTGHAKLEAQEQIMALQSFMERVEEAKGQWRKVMESLPRAEVKEGQLESLVLQVKDKLQLSNDILQQKMGLLEVLMSSFEKDKEQWISLLVEANIYSEQLRTLETAILLPETHNQSSHIQVNQSNFYLTVEIENLIYSKVFDRLGRLLSASYIYSEVAHVVMVSGHTEGNIAPVLIQTVLLFLWSNRYTAALKYSLVFKNSSGIRVHRKRVEVAASLEGLTAWSSTSSSEISTKPLRDLDTLHDLGVLAPFLTAQGLGFGSRMGFGHVGGRSSSASQPESNIPQYILQPAKPRRVTTTPI